MSDEETASKISDEEASFLFSTARIKATRLRPYFSSCLLALLPVRKAIGTMGVDKYGRIYYDPDKMKEWGPEKSSAVLIHECGHILRFHSQRAEIQGVTRDTAEIWNIAGDMAINDDLEEERLPLPDPHVSPKSVAKEYGIPIEDNRSEEEYYWLIKEKVEENTIYICMDSNCPSKNSKSGQNPGGGKGKHIHLTDCGSGAHGVKAEWEIEGIGDGEKRGLTTAEIKSIQRQVAKSIQEHVKNRGTVPGDWARWADEIIGCKVRWETELRVSLRQLIANRSGLVDFTMSKMSRRQSCFPKIILPALRRPSPKVAIIGDTSGSMDNKALGRAQAEVKGILKSTGAINDTLFLSVDAEVHNAKKIVKSSQIKFYGGGGTDMRVGFEYLKEKKIRPNVVVVFTDGYTPWPKDIYPWKTIVVLIGDNASMQGIPKAFKVVQVRD